MYLIVGLGNPGAKYLFTRHNIGFIAIDYILQDLSLAEKTEQKSFTYKYKYKDQDILFVKPQTYMNLSGEAVRGLMAFYKIPLQNLLVIHDDVDQNFLSIKFQKNSSSGGQNGINSIHELLGTQDYARLKLGVSRPYIAQQSTADHVLQNFNELEQSLLPSWLEEISKAVFSFIDIGFDKASNKYNFKAPHISRLIEEGIVKENSENDFQTVKNFRKK